ncbi:glutamine amidotransferase [Streptomyces sp. SID13666]|uniref:DJ-1/PfpI family protein n=1 Tax=unclassified Streptomyces TaxID=2593676 RepID=UPI0013BF272F|nr:MULTISPECIES: DJ-1/PfpI family protein [unclassified Streptomyces]NEA52725.1 glutamine amidotransferase [Streptomyces sp. SID13666]NEA69948.1 glutamine amidotransferase [Streptomyces sp. SID13588]
METREHETKTVYVAVYDTWSDWEVGHAIAHINSTQWQRRPGRYQVRTVGTSTEPVTTAGGVRIVPEVALAGISPQEAALLILPGAGLWDLSDDLAAFGRAARDFLAAGVPVAAICGATAGLAREGLLDDREHTSAAAEYLAATGYKGGDRYLEAPAVTTGDLITAGPTEPVAFAREIFARLDLYEPRVLDAWYRLFAHSDPSAFPVLMAAGS